MSSFQQVVCSMEVRDIEQLGQMFDNTEAHNVKIRRRTSSALSRSAVSIEVAGHSKTSSKGRRRLIVSDIGMDAEEFRARLQSFPDEAGADSVSLCTCQQSRNFPYCDSTHVVFNKETNSHLAPIVIKLTEPPSPTQPFSNIEQLSTCCTQQCTASTSDVTLQFETPQPTQDITESEEPEAHAPALRAFTPTSINDPLNKSNKIAKEEVAMHRKKDSLWMIINNNVYDITTYIPHHPGGEKALLKFGGADGSENVEFHSKSMLELLNKFYFIGKLDTGEPEKSYCVIS